MTHYVIKSLVIAAIATVTGLVAPAAFADPEAGNEPTVTIDKDLLEGLKGIKIDRSRPIRIQIPGVIDLKLDLQDGLNTGPDCEALYRNMIKSGTLEAKDAYHDACIDNDDDAKKAEPLR